MSNDETKKNMKLKKKNLLIFFVFFYIKFLVVKLIEQIVVLLLNYTYYDTIIVYKQTFCWVKKSIKS
jgi:hypothetical protein